MNFTEDPVIYPAVVRLLACLSSEISDSGLPTPNDISPLVGQLVLDYCGECSGNKNGQAWVRVVEAFPSSNFPQPDVTPLNCGTALAFQLEMGIARCKPTGTNNGVRGYNPPTLEEKITALRLIMADMAAMHRAISCCFEDEDLDYIMGSYTPLQVDGDCMGGVITITVRG